MSPPPSQEWNIFIFHSLFKSMGKKCRNCIVVFTPPTPPPSDKRGNYNMRDSRQTVRYQQRSTGWYCDLQQTPIKKQMPSVKSCAAPLLLRQSASDQSIQFTAALIFIISLVIILFYFPLYVVPSTNREKPTYSSNISAYITINSLVGKIVRSTRSASVNSS